MKITKHRKEVDSKVDLKKEYTLDQAVELLKQVGFARFDETIEVALNLNLKKSSVVRDTLTLPHQFRGEKRVLVFAKGDKATEAQQAGATYVGDDEYINKIKQGWFEFDVVIATPDMMKDVGRLGAILGRRGLMPNPRTKTVTMDIAQTVQEFKQGRTEYKSDKTGVLHMALGKVSMNTEQVLANIQYFLEELWQRKPQDAGNPFIQSMSITTTMGPGLKVNNKEFMVRG